MGCYNSPPLKGIAPRDSKKKRKEKSRDSRIEDDFHVRDHEIVAKVFVRLFGGRRCSWFKVDEKIQQLCQVAYLGAPPGKHQESCRPLEQLDWFGEGRHLE